MVWCSLALDLLLEMAYVGVEDRTGQPNAMAARGFLRAIQAGSLLPRQNILILFDRPGMIDG